MSPGATASQASSQGHRPPRRWPRRLLLGANIIALVALLGAGGAYAYVHYRVGQIRRVVVQGTAPSVAPGNPENFLLVGSDSRAGESSQAAQQFGSATMVAGQRSDVIILVHLDPRTGQAAMLSIPRDTLVPIAGTSTSNKINIAFDTGPSQLIQTINQDFGIPIQHYAEVNFSGLQGLVDTVGGVCMHFPYAVRDGSPTGYGNESGLQEPAGNDQLNGTQALSLVRSRYYQYLQDGYWHVEGTGDLGRIQRQHEFLRVLASKAITAGIHNPITANALIGQAVHDVTVDSGLSTSDILRLVTEFRSLHPSQIPSWTLPTTAVSNYQSYGDVLLPTTSEDTQVINAWQDYGAPAPTPPPARSTATSGPPATVPVASVTVQVLNGSGVSGQAGQAAQDLRSVGFSVAGASDATSFDHPTSVVTFGPGQQAAARTVAELVQGGASVSEDPGLSGSTVVLTTGSSFAGISSAPGSSASSASPTSTPTSAGTAGAGAGAGTMLPGQSPPPPWDPTACPS